MSQLLKAHELHAQMHEKGWAQQSLILRRILTVQMIWIILN